MKKFLTFIISILTLTCILSASSVYSFADTQSNTKLETEIVLPSTYQEYFELFSPTDIYYDNEVTAILEVTEFENGQKQTRLIVYKNGEYKTATFPYTLSQLWHFGNFLVTAKNSRPYLINLDTLEISEKALNDSEENEIDIHCFAANSKHLATKNKSGIFIYKVTVLPDTLKFEKLSNTIGGVASSDNTKIAINENNDIFYFKLNGKLASYKFFENGQSPDEKEYEFFKPDGVITDIIADNNYFYVLSSDSLQKIDIENEEAKALAYLKNSENVISDLKSPKSMTFKDGNVLIADNNCNKIVELSSKDFSYTGFAITTTASANNRLTANTKDISVLGEKIAILNGKNGFTVTDGKTFNISNDSDKLASASNIALGEEKVAFTNSNELYFVDLTNKEIEQIDVENYDNITSIAYASGNFYLSTYQNIFIVSEFIVSETEKKVEKFSVPNNLTNLLTADVDGNIYVYSKTIESNIITEYNSKGATLDTFNLTYESKDLGVDVNGNVYSLSNGNVIEYFKNGSAKTAELDISKNLPEGVNATSMAISYDSQKIYFLFDGKGFILSTEFAENDAITNVSVPSNFALTGSVANDVNTLKLYNLKENSNIYEISTNYSGETFIYENLSQADKSDYVYAGIAYCKTSYGEHPFLILANENRLILIKQNDATEKTIDLTADISSGYTGTKFNLYYYPILTSNGLYALENATLAKNTAINVLAEVEINGRSFYYASVDGKNGYIIKTAVIETLAEQFVRGKFSYKNLMSCNIYTDATMSEVATSLTQKTTVKATKVENDIYCVEFTTESGETINGFVYEKYFTKNGEKAVRNAIIIGILAFSVSATSIFFIYRKRR